MDPLGGVDGGVRLYRSAIVAQNMSVARREGTDTLLFDVFRLGLSGHGLATQAALRKAWAWPVIEGWLVAEPAVDQKARVGNKADCRVGCGRVVE